ncbi:hypothetical protein PMZ80_000859 [Knufia obscura]|uniref:Alpha-acetolactate decarboxylase n=2 Tax=Knufia TaxID=430999 RepID=A0AAN8I1T8_9EURO|nr:hypothetical protein PMZ80_000859 [Knufia obscura]KAK5949877.1 hypothetical protein OHC33_009062 [Knufia fluminis]
MVEPNHIYQYSIINALMAGVADSGIPVSQFTSKGNQGIGTFTKIQGELVLLDDKVYQLQASGSIRTAGPEEQLPYAVATQYEPQRTIRTPLKDKDDIDRVLEEFNDHAGNLFMSYRVDGRFKKLKARTVRGQEYEGQPLSELGSKQAVQEYEDIEGTIVGFRAPAAWQGFMVAGEHMHFIDRDRNVGGHLLELESDGEVEFGVAVVNNVHIELPTSEKFNAARMTTEDAGIKGIEG